MKPPRWMFNLGAWIARQRKPMNRLRVTNLTRNSVLAGNLEVADTSASRNKGLLGRAGLAAGEGLWILPCQSVHTFGMQFSIDLVYLDRKHRVRKVRSSVPPWRISACLSAHSVLELPSGTIRATETLPGDEIEFAAAPSSAPSGSLGNPAAPSRPCLEASQ